MDFFSLFFWVGDMYHSISLIILCAVQPSDNYLAVGRNVYISFHFSVEFQIFMIYISISKTVISHFISRIIISDVVICVWSAWYCEHWKLPLVTSRVKFVFQSKSQDHLVAYLAYIKTCLDDNKPLLNMDHLKEIAVIMTSHGPVKAADVGIHFTPLYLNKIDLEQCLPGK